MVTRNNLGAPVSTVIHSSGSNAGGSRIQPLTTQVLRAAVSVNGYREVTLARRYTVIIADRSSGVVRRVTINLRPFLVTVVAIASVPILMGLGAKWSAHAEVAQLKTSNAALLVENGSYRAATGELTSQIQSLEDVITDLGTRAKVD